MSGRPIAPALLSEIDRDGWMYNWELAPGVSVPTFGPNLEPVHTTRLEMIEPVVRAALGSAGPGSTVLDLACNEGWFAHRMLEWGAGKVVGIDIREDNVRRATLLRDHFGLSPERFSIHLGDVLDLDPDMLGRFDVVLVLGLIYHMERPLDAIRVARGMTRGLCVIESQLTRQERPIVRGDGQPGIYLQSSESFAAWVENNEGSPLASVDGSTMSLIPNRAALGSMPRWAGFSSVEFLTARPHHDIQYVEGDRAIVVARP